MKTRLTEREWEYLGNFHEGKQSQWARVKNRYVLGKTGVQTAIEMDCSRATCLGQTERVLVSAMRRAVTATKFDNPLSKILEVQVKIRELRKQLIEARNNHDRMFNSFEVLKGVNS